MTTKLLLLMTLSSFGVQSRPTDNLNKLKAASELAAIFGTPKTWYEPTIHIQDSKVTDRPRNEEPWTPLDVSTSPAHIERRNISEASPTYSRQPKSLSLNYWALLSGGVVVTVSRNTDNASQHTYTCHYKDNRLTTDAITVLSRLFASDNDACVQLFERIHEHVTRKQNSHDETVKSNDTDV